jgi:O-antigen ligase
MSSLKPMQLAGIGLGLSLALYLLYTHLQYLGDVSFLGMILMLEIMIAGVWKYDQRFMVLLIVTFVWAGANVPLQGFGVRGRWVVLFTGAVVGYIAWTKNPRRPFGALHLIAFFCVCSAFVSATVSSYIQMASLKALSLLLLFTYCASGARRAAIGREDRFFRGLLLGCEITAFSTATCYFGLGQSIWGNPNSLGLVMSVGVFPVLLWGWLNTDGPVVKFRRLVALLLCTYLVHFSMARAAMISVVVVTFVFLLCLHQYRLMMKVAGLVVLLVAFTGTLAPETLYKSLGEMKDAMLYKGHKEAGIMASRRSPWEKAITSIKEHPLFGTGYGTSPTGEDPGLNFGRFASSAETVGEHGSSYMTLAEWVGLLGGVPFVALLGLTVLNIGRVCMWMRRTADPRNYAIPLAMVVLAGLIHANFEDWLFAVGYYGCVYFWVIAFLLTDFVPDAVVVPAASFVPRVSRPSSDAFGAVVPNR